MGGLGTELHAGLTLSRHTLACVCDQIFVRGLVGPLFSLRLVVPMRPAHAVSIDTLTSLCLSVLTALGLFLTVLFAPHIALAQQQTSVDPTGPSASTIPGIVVSPPRPQSDSTDGLRRQPDMRPLLGDDDAAATLAHVLHALVDVGDGSTYVWHRHHGRLSGTIRPTSSFVAGSGRLCRHIVMTMAAGGYINQTEGVACRLESGRWQLEG